MQAWIKVHGAALVTFAGAIGALVSGMGLVDASVQQEITGIGAGVGLIGAVIHSYLRGSAPD